MSESKFRQALAKRLRAKGRHVQCLEVMTTKGVPDINWCAPDTWTELKFLPDFPVREKTPVRLRHFEWEQVWWLVDRGKAGGRSWLMSKIGKEIFIHHWSDCEEIKGAPTQERFRELALWYGSDWDECIGCCIDERFGYGY